KSTLVTYIINTRSLMNSQKAENTNIDWEEVILCLQSFTRALVKGKGWFRGGETSVFLKGQEIEDYIFEAIERYLRNPEKHKPEKGSLINYLKFNLIRSLVTNDLVSAENRTSSDIFNYESENFDEENSATYLDSIFPYAEAFFDQEIDFNEVMKYLENEVKNDTIVENIFLGICCYGLKRREITEEFAMTEKDYDNGMRRFNTIKNNTVLKFDLKNRKL